MDDVKKYSKKNQKKFAELKKAVSLRPQKMRISSLTWWKNIYENR